MTERRLVLQGRGHPAIRATHTKTIEFTRDVDLGAGGTCIVAVGSSATGGVLAGPVHLELVVGSTRFEFAAVANPDWDAAGPAVIRKSDQRRADTLATNATHGAADLPGEVRRALADPGAEVTLTVTAAPTSGLHVVIADGPVSAAEYAAADAVLDASSAESGTDTPDAGRVLVVGAAAPPALLAAAVQPVEVHGLGPAQAVAAASPYGRPAQTRDLAAVADPAERSSAIVLRIDAGELDRVLKSAQRHGRRTGAVLGRLPWVRWGRLDELTTPAGSRSVWVCLDPAEFLGSDDELLARIRQLRTSGDTTKALAKRLANEFGVPVSRVYALAVESGKDRT